MARSDQTLYNLPETKAASKGARVRLDALLREAHSLRQLEKRLKEVKAEILEIIQQQDLADEDGHLGCRLGELCAVGSFNKGRRTLDRTLLIENGVTPGQIEASMKQGADFWKLELQVIGEAASAAE